MLSIAVPRDFPSKATRYQEDPPDRTRYSKTYQQLNLEYRGLRKIPIKFLSYRIVTLHLDHNALSSLPSPSQLPELQELNVDYNQLATIPDYPTLKQLSIAHNPCQYLPLQVAANVTELDLSHTLVVFPIDLASCVQLFAGGCRWKDDTVRFSAIPNVLVLDCCNSGLTKISPSAKMVCLEEIALSDNQLTHIPAFRSLINLIATGNNLRTIESSPMLDYLDVSWNKLVSLCPSSTITNIIAHHNRLEMIESYPKVTSIDVSDNRVTSIADQPELVELFAGNNRISQLGSMPCVEVLDLENNLLTSFQITSQMTNLILTGNPLATLEWPNGAFALRTIQVPLCMYQSIYSRYRDQIAQVLFHLDRPELSRRFLPILTSAGYPDPKAVTDALVSHLTKAESPFASKLILDHIPSHLLKYGKQLIAAHSSCASASISFAKK